MGIAEQFKAGFIERDLPVVGKVFFKELGPAELEALPDEAGIYDIIAATAYEGDGADRKLAFESVEAVRALKWRALRHLVDAAKEINGLDDGEEGAKKNSNEAGSSDPSSTPPSS